MFVLGPLLHNTAAFASAGSSAWTPANLSTALFAWFTADQASTVNTGSSNVWTAYSGSGGPLTQTTGANRPTYSGSGTTSKLTFDSTDELDLTGVANGGYDMFAVITSNSSTAAYRTLFWNFSSAHACLIEVGTNRLGCYNSAFVDSGLTIAPSTQAIIAVRIDSTLGTAQISLNGGTLTSALTNFASGQRSLSVLGSASGAGQPVGDVHAVVVTNSLLDTTAGAEFDKTVGSLAWEWGLAGLLPGGHPYKSAAP